MDRVASLAPSATATVLALGGRDALVGVTEHDDVEGIEALGGWLTPDLDRVAALDPDVVLTADPLQREIRDALRARGLEVSHHEPRTLGEVLAGFGEIGAAVGLAEAARDLERTARRRLEAIRRSVPTDPRPVVYCEEWPDPPMAAGNWVPEVVEAAGGRYPFVGPGERSSRIDASAVAEADPAHIVVHHCGRGEAASIDLEARGWDVDASVHLIDDDLLNQPGPRLVDGAELLADLCHPDRTPLADSPRTQPI